MVLLSRCAVSFEALESRRLLCAGAASTATQVATPGYVLPQDVAIAPATFAGLQLNVTITSGTSPLLLGTSFQIVSGAGLTYFLVGPSGLTLSTGTYTYAVTTPTTATL